MFEVGKKVICVKTHHQSQINGVIKGRVFEVHAIKKGICKCSAILLDVGIAQDSHTTYCRSCDKLQVNKSGGWWMRATLFAPLTDETIGDKTIEELMGDTVTVDNERYFQLEQQNINHSA